MTVFSYFVVFIVTSGYALNMMIGRRSTVTHIAGLLVVAGYVAGALWAIEGLIGSPAPARRALPASPERRPRRCG